MKKASIFIRISGQIDSRGLYECVKQMGMNVTDLVDMTLVYGDCDVDDVEELYNLLKPIIDIDLRNYEDYMCDDWYRKDSRWE